MLGAQHQSQGQGLSFFGTPKENQHLEGQHFFSGQQVSPWGGLTGKRVVYKNNQVVQKHNNPVLGRHKGRGKHIV